MQSSTFSPTAKEKYLSAAKFELILYKEN